MLNKGLRDEESTRIENTLRILHSLTFVPKYWIFEDLSEIDGQLKNFGLSLETLIESEPNEMITLLSRCHLDWNQKEQFADVLIFLSKENQFQFTAKALALYEHIQTESATFSFGINTKITSAKAKLQ
ncbi:hypothetical protein ACRASX_05265 [Flavobacterium sp. TMP13]|uniref:hypothetical protein n=1 Tax=Flavobacterium sp. TMP13 TaxID=3425950 RepID=UPI003D782827